MRHNIIRVALAAGVVAAALTVSGCAGADRWCEEDSTDTVADNSLCAAGVPGFEWEPDTHKTKKRPTRSAVPRPTPPRATGGWPPSATPAPASPVPPKPVVPTVAPTAKPAPSTAVPLSKPAAPKSTSSR